MFKRNFDQLSDGPFDVLIIGGGIYGAWIAADAAQRGMKVALIERRDWASGTSSSSSKLIHGGLRYLEHYDFGLVRHALLERKHLYRIAPHRIQPLRFALPVYKGDRSRAMIGMGLRLYDLLAGFKQPVKRAQRLSKIRFTETYPWLKDDDLRGGFTYGDCQNDDARFCLEVVANAAAHGAVTVNYAAARELVVENDEVKGAIVRDKLDGHDVQVNAKLTINAAGPWAISIPGMKQEHQDLARFIKGVHLVMPALPCEEAFLLTAKQDGRVFFLIPWYGQTLLGTTESDFDDKPDNLSVNDDDIDYLLDAVNEVLKTPWIRDDIQGAYAGLRTLRNEDEDNPSAVSREWVLEQPLFGLLMPIGGKQTTARDDAMSIVNRAVELLGHDGPPNRTGEIPLPWSPGQDFDVWQQAMTEAGVTHGLDREVAHWVTFRHGKQASLIHKAVTKQPELAERIHKDAPFCKAEVIHAIEYEMAQTLVDILRRRLPLVLLCRPTVQEIAEMANLAGSCLGWSESQKKQQIASVQELVFTTSQP